MLIEVIYDPGCPWCFIGKRQLERALAARPRAQATVRWWPFLLNPDMPAEGVDRSTYLMRKFGSQARISRVFGAISDFAEAVGIEFAFDRIQRTPNTRNAHRLILWAKSGETQDRVVEALFSAFFVEGRNLADDEVLIDIGASCGLDRDLLAELFATDADIERTQREYASAQRIGVTGVPFFIVAGRYGIAGAESPETIAGAIRQAAGEMAAGAAAP